jgi:hypothetical protein
VFETPRLPGYGSNDGDKNREYVTNRDWDGIAGGENAGKGTEGVNIGTTAVFVADG